MLADRVRSSGFETVTITYTATGSTAVDGDYSASHSIGTAANNRRIIVAVGGSSTAATINSVTVDGAATSLVGTRLDTLNRCSIYVTTAAFTSGTSATIAVDWTSTGQNRTGIGVWAMYGGEAGTGTFNSTINADPTQSITTPVRGSAICYYMCLGGSGNPVLTGAFTQNFTGNVEGSAYHVGGTLNDSAGGGDSATVTTPGTDSDASLVMAAWGPG